MRPRLFPFAWLLLFLLVAMNAPVPALAWGPGHTSITRGALEVLPSWEKEMLGPEWEELASRHCLIPDQVYSHPEIRRYAMMESQPGVVYLVNLHLPAGEADDFELLRYFLEQAVNGFAAGDPAEGARFAGTVAHALEDWGCPAHSVPGDNMFSLFKQFLPPPEAYRHVPLHGPMESGIFEVKLGSYQPRLLGTTVPEAAYHLLHRVRESTIQARSQVIPILQALYADDAEAANTAQGRAGEVDAMVVADALHTILSLARQRFEPDAVRELETVDLSARIPGEAANLAFPQSAFFSKPFWGHALRGVTLREGKEPVPLRLRVEEKGKIAQKTFARALGVGTKSTLTFMVPPGVYRSFEVWAGLHAELGREGSVVFEVKGNGAKVLATVGPVRGDALAQRIAVPMDGVTSLQLTVTSAGGAGLGNYAIWAEPELAKAISKKAAP